MAQQQTQTLDKNYSGTKKPIKHSKVVNTALKMIDDYRSVKSAKEENIKRVRDLFLEAVNGEVPTRSSQMPSYLINQLDKSYKTMVRIPDIKVNVPGGEPIKSFLMSKFLEEKINEGGFKELMTTGFGGYRQQGLYGDFFVLCGVKDKGQEGMPLYRGLGVGEVYFDKNASVVRSLVSGQSARRCGIIYRYDAEYADQLFPGIMEGAEIGELPSSLAFDSPTNMKTNIQDTLSGEQPQSIEIMFFYDRVSEVFSIIAGANAYEYKTLKGEDYPFIMEIGGEEQAVLPIAHLKYDSSLEGIFGTGYGEDFYKLTVNDGKINTSFTNNTLDNNNAPAILNIDNASANDIFQQLALATELKEAGENAFIVPELSEDDKKAGKTLGRQQVDYLNREPFGQDNERLKTLYDQQIRRMGHNLDLNFSDPDKTLGQTEIDRESANASVSDVHSDNENFYRFIAEFAVNMIKKFGDENDDRPFGSDLKIDIDGEETTLEENRQNVIEQGLATEESMPKITNGMMVKMFKDEENIEIEIDTTNGVNFNKFLERISLQRLLNTLIPGTPAHAKAVKKLAELDGQMSFTDEDFAIAQQGGTMGAAQPFPEAALTV